VTLASIGSLGGGGFQFISAEGKFLQMKPRDIAAPQTLFQWDGGGIQAFSEAWLRAAPSHHHTAAYGRLNRRITLTAEMLGLPHAQV
jgi:L-arabinose isomerase